MATENRLIYANEALRMIEDSRTDNPYFHAMTRPIWELAHDCALSCVIACPTVDAVEVVHGRWEQCFEDWRKQIEGDECSVCHTQWFGFAAVKEFKYCPNCGAKMDGDGNGTLD